MVVVVDVVAVEVVVDVVLDVVIVVVLVVVLVLVVHGFNVLTLNITQYGFDCTISLSKRNNMVFITV